MLFVFHSQNRILWIDEKNLTAHVEAGIVGQDLERLVSTAHPSIFFRWKNLHYCKRLCQQSSCVTVHVQAAHAQSTFVLFAEQI